MISAWFVAHSERVGPLTRARMEGHCTLNTPISPFLGWLEALHLGKDMKPNSYQDYILLYILIL